MEQFLFALRSRPWLARLLPSTTYIGTSAVILLASGPWVVSAAGWDIYVGAVAWTLLMLVLAIVFVKRASHVGLQPLNQHDEPSAVLAGKIIGYFFIVVSMRQLMIWQFYNPWEKLPLVFLVLLQVTIVEGARLEDLGLRGWHKRDIALACILAGFEIGLINGMATLLYIGTYGPGILENIAICSSCQLYWLSFPYQFLAVGFGEEVFFRGYIYTKLRVHLGNLRGDKASFWGAMAVTNALFGLFHVPWYVGNWLTGDFSFDIDGCIIRVVVTAIMGVGLAYLYEKTGSLAAPMLAHGFSNSIQPLIKVSGTLPPVLPNGDFLLSINSVLIGFTLLVIYIAFTRWYVPKTGDRTPVPPWREDRRK